MELDQSAPLLPRRATKAEARLTRAEWGLLAVLTVMQFTLTLDFLIIAPLGPQLMGVFGITTGQFGSAVAAYAYSAAVSSFAAAFFLDRFDRKRSLLALYAGFALGTLCCGLAPNYGFLVAARVVAGLFGGVCGGVVFAIVGDAIPEVRRATAMGTVMSAFALASALGVPVGLWLAERTWQWPFYALTLASAVIWVPAFWLLPKSDSHLRSPRDESAVERMRLVLSDANHLRAFTLMAAMTFGAFMVVPYISAYMVGNVGLTQSQLKYNFASAGFFTLFTMNAVGRLADRFGRRLLFTILTTCAAVMMLVVTHLPAVTLTVAAATVTVFMICMTGRFVPAMTMITGTVTPRHRGGFMSVNSCVQQVAGGLGVNAGGYLLVDGVGHRLIGYGWVGCISASLALACIVLAARLRNVERDMVVPADALGGEA